jgi:hypothetical protein
MRLRSFSILVGICFLGCSYAAKLPKSYEKTPALLHVSSLKQHDSIGFNLVQALQELIYPKLLTGDLALWEGSDKKKIVEAQNFRALERNARLPFVSSNDLFVYEYWEIFNKIFTFDIQGFSFTGTTKAGKKINYGYVDIQDITNLLKNTTIPANASGSADLSFWNALHSKSYSFHLVQFGHNNFKSNLRASLQIQYQALQDPSINRAFTKIVPVKKINYKVLAPDINSNLENKNFYRIFTETVNKNKQTILNNTAADHFQTILFLPWEIDQINILEKWSKYKNIPFQELESVELIIDKNSVILSSKQLEELGIKLNLQSLEEYISEKRFSFLLDEINTQEISPQQSETYYKLLLTNPWNKITL